MLYSVYCNLYPNKVLTPYSAYTATKPRVSV